MKPRSPLLAIPILLGIAVTFSLFLGLKPPAAALAAAIDEGSAVEGGWNTPTAAQPQPENADEIFSSAAGWFANKDWATNAVAWIDIDQDGDLDLALANGGEFPGDPNYLLIYENTSQGIRYTPQQTVTLPSDALAMAWGDIDADGWLDVAVGMTETLVVYPTLNGKVVTTPIWSYDGYGVASVALADLEGDDYLDLAAVICDEMMDCRAQVFWNDAGTLEAVPSWQDASIQPASSLAWGDMDADGWVDLAVGYLADTVQVYWNDSGSLEDLPYWESISETMVSQLAWADVNQDGYPELGVANWEDVSQVYSNTGGILDETDFWESSDAYTTTTSLAWGDLDADGYPDLILGNELTSTVLYWNTEGSLPEEPDWSSDFRNIVRSVAWGDMDADGDLDLAVGMNGSQSRVVVNEMSTLEFLASVEWDPAELVGVIDQAWGDINRDGWMDLAVVNVSFDENDVPLALNVAVYRNNNGVIASTPLATVYTTALDPEDIEIAIDLVWADVNGDGWLDLSLASQFSGPRLFLNNGSGSLNTTPAWSATDMLASSALAYADADGDGDLDLAVAGYSEMENASTRLYRSNNGSLGTTSIWSAPTEGPVDVAWGDFDRDGDPDLAVAQNYSDKTYVYQNAGGVLAAEPYWQASDTEPSEGVAWGDVDNDGDLDLAVFNLGAQSRIYLNDNGVIADTAAWESQETENFGGDLADADGDGDIDVLLYGLGLHIYLNENGSLWQVSSWKDTDIPYVDAANWVDVNADGRMDLAYVQDLQSPALGIYLRNAPGHPTNDVPVPDLNIDLHTNPAPTFGGKSSPALAPTDNSVAPAIRQGVVPIRYLVDDPEGLVTKIRAFYSTDGGGRWLPAVGTVTGSTSPYTFNWDVAASGLFGRADNVVFRIEAVLDTTQLVDNLPQTDGRQPMLTATSLPFRVRGTQIRVMNGSAPAANALVYNLPQGSARDGAPIADLALVPFRTDSQGYLMGRAEIKAGDQLLALAPQFISTTYTTYFTNGFVHPLGVNGTVVAPTGVQTLTVSSASPLILFNLSMSLEWDSSQDPAYLEQLQANIQRASEYLYDFTNGQIALGQVEVYQNADSWLNSHITVYANNRMRPWAIEGGVVLTTTTDPLLPDLAYFMGQLSIGSVWNRYGTPGQSMGDDWPIILAHELSHYLLFQDDVYMGLNADGQIIPIMTCTGSAMGDVYSDPANTEFIYNEAEWDANCADTLANKLLQRPEWATIDAWYPAVVIPTTINTGPSSMPFDFTNVAVNAPLTPTNVLIDPVYYVDYAGGSSASTSARAYLERNGLFLRNLGAPTGGQNSLTARGAQVGDRLCVFDPARLQFGCEVIELGDNRLTLQQDSAWNPIVSLTPVNTTTLNITLSNVGNLGPTTVQARLFPKYQDGLPPITLTWNETAYAGTFNLAEATLEGMLQVWVNEAASEEDPRRETILPFSVGGNPGYLRASGGGGGYLRASGGGGGYLRASGGGGGFQRAGNAPLMSPDGSLIFFTDAATVFPTGTLFTIQSMAGVPVLPAGRQMIGQAYQIIASPDVVLPDGSISVQYLGNDVTVAGADESDLRLYYYNGTGWLELATILDTYYNMVSAPSQGTGIYALLASVRIPLYGPGWNMFAFPLREAQPLTTALASIEGFYTTLYGFDPTLPVDERWLVYDTSHAPIFNTLLSLEFGKGYWINASESLTLFLSPQAQDAPLAPDIPAPPALFYGVLLPKPGFTPQAGMLVQAYANGLPCGQDVAEAYQGQVVYSVIAWNDNACALAGAEMTFTVNGQAMRQAALWDNSASQRLDLYGGDWQIFLPVTNR